MELVEGETLADRLRRGAMPVEDTLKIALQIADALEAAHEKSIVHRDLKPANVKITPDEKVKVLDFGLAKAVETDRTGRQRVGLADAQHDGERRPASSSAPPRTCRRSRRRASPPITAATCSRSASCSTRC